MKSIGRADLACVAFTLIWGANIPVVKDAVSEISPMSFNALRMTLGAIVLSLIALKGSSPRLNRDDWPAILVGGIIGNGVYQLLFTHGISLTRAGNTALILATGSVFTALMSRVAGHERPGVKAWLGIATTLGGVSLVLLGRDLALNPDTFVGDLLIVGCSICWAFYTVHSKPMMQKIGSLRYTAITLNVGAVVGVLSALPWLASEQWSSLSTKTWVEISGSGLLALAAAYALWFYSVSHLGGTRTSVWNSLVPFVALALAYVFLGEPILTQQWVGGILILSGIVLTRRDKTQ